MAKNAPGTFAKNRIPNSFRVHPWWGSPNTQLQDGSTEVGKLVGNRSPSDLKPVKNPPLCATNLRDGK